MSDEPIYMLNALWFEGEAGAAHYAEFAAAAAPYVEKYGGRLVASHAPDLALVGDWDPDLFFVVEWPSWEAFQRLPADPGYQEVALLRERGLRRSLLLRCRAASVALPQRPVARPPG